MCLRGRVSWWAITCPRVSQTLGQAPWRTSLRSTPTLGWKFLGPFEAFLPLSLCPCLKNVKEWDLCKDLTYMWESMNLLDPAPCRAVLSMGNSICLCWWSSITNAESVNLINKDSCCTSTLVGHLCRYCHHNAPSSYTKCITNIPWLCKSKNPHLASQLQWGFNAFPYERQLCASQLSSWKIWFI